MMRGWPHEPARHSLAARGIETGKLYHGTNKSISKKGRHVVGSNYFPLLGDGLYVSDNEDFVEQFGDRLFLVKISPDARIKEVNMEEFKKYFYRIVDTIKRKMKILNYYRDVNAICFNPRYLKRMLGEDSQYMILAALYLSCSGDWNIYTVCGGRDLESSKVISKIIRDEMNKFFKGYDAIVFDAPKSMHFGGAKEIVIKNKSIIKKMEEST